MSCWPESRTDLRSALQILDVLDEIADRTHNTRYKIEILALRALALDAQGETSEAERLLKQALDLARPGGFIRVFVDLGIPMQEMLRRLAKQDHSEVMIRRILAAFPEDDVNLVGSSNPRSPDNSPRLSHPALAEPLTPRELEVLSLTARAVEHQRNRPQSPYFLRHCQTPYNQHLRQAWTSTSAGMRWPERKN